MEIRNATGAVLSGEQVEIIRNHLNLVFKHEIDPSMGTPQHQAVLNEVHTPHVGSGVSRSPALRC